MEVEKNISIIHDLQHPFNFYKVLLKSDMLHFGYWKPGTEEISLEEAQEAATELLLKRIPDAPARILDIGCGLGATSKFLHDRGYDITAISPDKSAIEYADQHHPGPNYVATGFLDEHAIFQEDNKYDVILLQESLQYFPDLASVFSKMITLLKDQKSQVIMCDEVSYSPDTNRFSVVKQVEDIEKAFMSLGFYVQHHKIIGKEVLPTCEETLKRFEEKRAFLHDNIPDSENHLEHYIEGWKHQKMAYQSSKMGYEIWNLRHGDITINEYKEGDELQILPAFNKAFNVSRTASHWLWKFKHNPWGGPFVSLAWDGSKIAAQYTGYPLILDIGNNDDTLILQSCDTFTLQEYRGVGIGRNNLLARIFRFFERNYLERKIFVAYGFNTGNIRRLCQLFLGITVNSPICEWHLPEDEINKVKNIKTYRELLSGLSIIKEEKVGNWADQIYKRARNDYPWLLKRTKKYLAWRYEQHPDFSYTFYMVKHWGKPIGWWLVRIDENKLYLVDAFFSKKFSRHSTSLALQRILKDNPDITLISGWFSETPKWWTDLLMKIGFEKKRQFQDLYLAVKSYSSDVTPEIFTENFYFTMGDSDLY